MPETSTTTVEPLSNRHRLIGLFVAFALAFAAMFVAAPAFASECDDPTTAAVELCATNGTCDSDQTSATETCEGVADSAVSSALGTLVQKVLDTFSANLPTVIAVAGVFVGLSVVISLFYRFARQ